jgi:hypothetical protein
MLFLWETKENEMINFSYYQYYALRFIKTAYRRFLEQSDEKFLNVS